MDAQQYRRILREGDPNILHKDYKGIKWAEEELKRIKKITDLEKQQKEAERIWYICDNVYGQTYNPPIGVNINEPYGLNHFKELYEELKDLKNKSFTPKPNSKKCSQCSKEVSSNPVNKEFCSKPCSLFAEIKILISKNYSNANADELYQLAQKLLELAQEYSKSSSPHLKPYCDSLIESLQKLVNDAHETWNSSTKLQNLSDYCQEKEKSIGTVGLGLLKAATYCTWPNTSYCFWSGYDWGKKSIRQRIEELEGNNKQGNETNYEEISCQQCFKEIKPGKTYWYHKTKNDGYKFCSKICYNKQGERESEERLTTYCRYCSAKTELFDVCDKQECLVKMNKTIENKKGGNNNSDNNNSIEREREQTTLQKQQLCSQIMQLENNPTKTPEQQAELEKKRKKLQELEQTNSLTVQIANLEKEIKELEGKSTRTQAEEALLASKKKQLAELLKQQNSSTSTTAEPSDKSALIIGCGIIAVFLIGLVFILVRRKKKH